MLPKTFKWNRLTITLAVIALGCLFAQVTIPVAVAQLAVGLTVNPLNVTLTVGGTR